MPPSTEVSHFSGKQVLTFVYPYMQPKLMSMEFKISVMIIKIQYAEPKG